MRRKEPGCCAGLSEGCVPAVQREGHTEQDGVKVGGAVWCAGPGMTVVEILLEMRWEVSEVV